MYNNFDVSVGDGLVLFFIFRFALVDFGLAHEAPVLKKLKQLSKQTQNDSKDADQLKKVLREMGNIPVSSCV